MYELGFKEAGKLPIFDRSWKKQRSSRETSTSASRPLTVWITTNCGKFLKIGVPDYITCLMRNLNVDQEATVSTGLGTTDWFKIGKGVCEGCILPPCLFNWYVKRFIQNAGLDESQAGIKTAGRNINNFRYTDDTTILAESKEELKSPLMSVKEESENAGLKFNIKKTKFMTSGPIISWQTDGEKVKAVTYFIILGSKITVHSDCSHEIKRCLLLERKLWET